MVLEPETYQNSVILFVSSTEKVNYEDWDYVMCYEINKVNFCLWIVMFEWAISQRQWQTRR